MKTKYTIIKPDGTQEDHVVDWPKEPGYDRIRAVVEPILGGGFLEHVAVLFCDKPHDMFVDEEGHLPHKNLPRNEKATAVYRRATLKRDPKRDPESIPWIAGTAIIFHRRVWM